MHSQPVQVFLLGFPAFCERHKNHLDGVVVVALRLVTLVLHLNDPPTKLYQVLCSFLSPDSLPKSFSKENQKVKDIRRGTKFAIKVFFRPFPR